MFIFALHSLIFLAAHLLLDDLHTLRPTNVLLRTTTGHELAHHGKMFIWPIAMRIAPHLLADPQAQIPVQPQDDPHHTSILVA